MASGNVIKNHRDSQRGNPLLWYTICGTLVGTRKTSASSTGEKNTGMALIGRNHFLKMKEEEKRFI